MTAAVRSSSRLKSKGRGMYDERRGALRGSLLFPSPMNGHLHRIFPLARSR